MRSLLAILFVAVASFANAAGPRVAIITSEFPHPLVQRAADELAADLKRLYDAKVEFAAAVVPGPPAQVIFLGMPDAHGHLKQLSDPLPKLSEQGHAVLSRKYKDRSVLAVVGGSPAATYWAAAELAHQWGVRTMLYGDVDPVVPRDFSVEGFDVVREPLVKSRVWQMDFDSPIGAASWSLADQKKLLRQLARMKFNRLVLSTKAETAAAAVAAFRPIEVSGDTAGRSAFGGAKIFENPDLASADSAAARNKAADDVTRGIESEAKALGMTVERIRTLAGAPRPPTVRCRSCLLPARTSGCGPCSAASGNRSASRRLPWGMPTCPHFCIPAGVSTPNLSGVIRFTTW
jgi:hypothetical protein